MSQNGSTGIPKVTGSPLNVIIGGAGIGLLVAAASVAYFKSQRQAGSRFAEAFESARSSSVPSFSFKGKWALSAAIKVIEHDASRKVLLAVLKSMVKRAR